NVTHRVVTQEDYQGPRHQVRNVLRAFDADRTRAWFASLGVTLKEEPTGKLFPVTDSAKTVLDALVRRARTLGVELWEDCRVQGVTPAQADPPRAERNARHGAGGRPRGFMLDTVRGPIRASAVILATGGQSLPKTGSDGQGW